MQKKAVIKISQTINQTMIPQAYKFSNKLWELEL